MANIKKNFMYQITYQIVLIILPLITAPYTARVLGAENIGAYSYTYAVSNYFVLFAMLGINKYGNRSIAASRLNTKDLNKEFSSLFILHATVCCFSLLGYVLFIILFIDENRTLFIIQAIFVFGALLDINWFYFGIEEFRITVTRNILFKIITTICIFLFVKDVGDLNIYAAIMSTGIVISQSVVWISRKKYATFVRCSWHDIMMHVKPMLLLFIPILAVNIYRMMGKIILGNLSTMVQVGYYENTDKLILVPIGVITALSTVMLPRISNLMANGRVEEAKMHITSSMQIMLLLSFGLAFGMAGIADSVVTILFGEEFAPSSRLLSLLSINTVILSWNSVIRDQFIIPNKCDKIYTAAIIAGAIVNILLNFILVPSMQAMGAVVSVIAAEIVVCVFQTIAVKAELPIKKYLVMAFPHAVFGVITFFVVKYLQKMEQPPLLSLALQIGTGLSVYLLLNLFYLKRSKNPIYFAFVKMIRKMMKLNR